MSASSAVKITKPVKPPVLKEAKTVTQETVFPKPRFSEKTDMYETRFDTEMHRHLGLSFSGSLEAEFDVEHEDQYEAQEQVC